MSQRDDRTKQSRRSIAIICLNAAGVIFQRTEKNVGGMEVRAWMLARALAKQSQGQVSFVVRDPAIDSQEVEGVQIVAFESQWSRAVAELSRSMTRTYSFPWIRVLRWSFQLFSQVGRLVTLRLFAASEKRDAFDAAVRRTNADVYMTFGISYYTRFAIELAKRQGIPSVLMIASDGDLDPRNRPGTNYVSEFGDRADDTWWSFQNADQIVVQTVEQQRMLKERFGPNSCVIENPIDLECWQAASGDPSQLPDVVRREAGAWLWVGRCERTYKQPDLLIKLARECSQERFLMILNPRDLELEKEIRRDCPSNVTIIESLPYELMPAVFGQSRGLISTSSQEGFPNTFLQAAACGIPIASLNVADSFLRASGSGVCAMGNWQRFVSILQQVSKPSSEVASYLQQHHSLKAVTDRLLSLLETLGPTHRP